MSDNGDTIRLKVSYLTMRKIVGVMGILLPIVMVLGTLLFTFQLDIRTSISAYSDSVMGPAFAGILFVVGWFLFAYKGHDDRDDRAGDRACLFAMGVAIFPHESATHTWVPWVHFVSAGLLFGTLAYFSWSLFTETAAGGTPTDEKLFRNKVYRACGVIMVLCIVLIAAYNLFDLKSTALATVRPVLVLEALALWAFGFSWFVKGETLWKDAA